MENAKQAEPQAPNRTPRERLKKSSLGGSVISIRHIELKLNAILRNMEAERRPTSTVSLMDRRFHLYSQNEEDGLVIALIRAARGTSMKFVDIGCGHNGGNCAMLAKELLFGGLMVDGSPHLVEAAAQRFERPGLAVRCDFVTTENIDGLIEQAGLQGDIDFLSVDIDGNDIWIWDAVSVVSPRVACVEYNSLLGAERSVAVPYDPTFVRRADSLPRPVQGHYYGCSLPALADVSRRKGYRLVAVEPRGTNAFLLRDDVAPEIPEVTPADAFRMLNKNRKRAAGGVDVFTLADQHGLPLIDCSPGNGADTI